MRYINLAVAGSLVAPGLDELPVFVELHDACVSVPTVPVSNEDVAIRSHYDSRRCIERIGTVARDTGLAQRHQNLSIRTKFEDLMPLAVFALAVRHPNVAILVHIKTVRKYEHTAAKALQQFPGCV